MSHVEVVFQDYCFMTKASSILRYKKNVEKWIFKTWYCHGNGLDSPRRIVFSRILTMGFSHLALLELRIGAFNHQETRIHRTVLFSLSSFLVTSRTQCKTIPAHQICFPTKSYILFYCPLGTRWSRINKMPNK